VFELLLLVRNSNTNINRVGKGKFHPITYREVTESGVIDIALTFFVK
jgi:hypothetical protein